MHEEKQVPLNSSSLNIFSQFIVVSKCIVGEKKSLGSGSLGFGRDGCSCLLLFLDRLCPYKQHDLILKNGRSTP